MRYLITIAPILLLAAGLMASIPDSVEVRKGAFYEGETLNYVVQPPVGFRMVDYEASTDGYSFAFIPIEQTYQEADILIGVNIFKIRGLKFDDVVTQDTLMLRKHYGDSLRIWEVDSVKTGSGDPARTFYLNDNTRYIPNVMISYLNGQTELVIFELIVGEHVLRVKAEESFLSCLRNTRAMERRELGQR